MVAAKARWPAVARIAVVPAATAVTTPVALTVATDGEVESHVTFHPFVGIGPLEPTAAVSASWSPTISVALTGETATEFTNDSPCTVITTEAVLPPALAVTTAAPGAPALSFPVDDTATIAASVDCQATGHPPDGGVPVVCSEAATVIVSLTVSVRTLGATAMLVIALGGGVVSTGGVVPP